MANSKVGVLIVVVATMILAAEGVHVSIGSMLDSPMSVHCVKGNDDLGVRVVPPMQEFRIDISAEFHGPYVCAFAAMGKGTTTIDVVHSRCNCETYSGCAWVVRNDGFYCNHDFMRTWA